VGKKYLLGYVKNELIRLHIKFNVKYPQGITAQTIKEYFNVDDKARIGNSKAILILSPKIYNDVLFSSEKVPDSENSEFTNGFTSICRFRVVSRIIYNFQIHKNSILIKVRIATRNFFLNTARSQL